MKNSTIGKVIGLLIVALLCMAMSCEDAEKQLRTQLGDEFAIQRSGIFVCAGNLDRETFTAIVNGTVTASAKALWTQYFTKRPNYAIRVYLFNDEQSYRSNAKRLFGDTDVSHFGYYKPDEKALVMNIGTGTGTLVHEMVHALMEPDFPAAPTWFSEGLASLYEQCRNEHGRLIGLVNWRLPVLQVGLKDKTTLPLDKLLATTRSEFLDENLGVHYAQARYLCQYMQQRGALEDFYRLYRDGYTKDNTGAKTLAKVFHQPIAKIETDWLAWVKTLKYE